MIVPMRHFSFLLHRNDLELFLEELQSLGMVHIAERATWQRSDPERKKKLEEQLQVLRRLPAKPTPPPLPRPADAEELSQLANELLDSREQLQQQLTVLRKSIELAKPWGNYHADNLAEFCTLSDTQVWFLSCANKDYQPAWEQQFALSTVNIHEGRRYFVLFSNTESPPQLPKTTQHEAPSSSIETLQARFNSRQAQHESATLKLRQLATQHLDLLESEISLLDDQLRFEEALTNADSLVQDQVRLIQGYVPEPRRKAVHSFCEQHRIVYLDQKADATVEAPPVLLKNSAFSKVFEPITKLFALPNYQEPDLTPFFAPFFMLFFGFCLGDAGYGLLLLLGASVYKLRASPDWQPHLRLLQFLGLGTILFGILTGTFFGFNLLEDRFASLGNLRNLMLNNDQVFNLALALGFVQVLFALTLQTWFTWRRQGWKYALRLIGWILLLISLPLIFLVPALVLPAKITAWGSLALIVLFSDPKASLLKRFGLGLWDLYNITGFFGDILSYIRLFALGISSAILGYVVNEIGFQIKDSVPVLGPVLFVLFLLVGHGANLLIASLGAFVHPMRLTFLEFYKNAGFQGGGKAYTPFSRSHSLNNEKND